MTKEEKDFGAGTELSDDEIKNASGGGFFAEDNKYAVFENDKACDEFICRNCGKPKGSRKTPEWDDRYCRCAGSFEKQLYCETCKYLGDPRPGNSFMYYCTKIKRGKTF